MKLERLNRGEATAMVASIALFVLMFLGWYGTEISGQVGRISYGGLGEPTTAWDSLGWVAAVLALTIAAGVGAAVLRLRGSRMRPAIPANAVVAVLGGLSTILVLYRILNPPDFGAIGGVTVEPTPRLPAYLGLVAAAGIAYGGYRAMGQRGSSFAQIADALAVRPARVSASEPKKGSEKRPERRS